MLSIHYDSMMMWIVYIDWQQYWKCDWTMNIGANRNAQCNHFFQADYHNEEFFFFFFFFFFLGGGGGGGACSAPMHLLFGAVYRSQVCRGILDVSNVALVEVIHQISSLHGQKDPRFDSNFKQDY